MIRRVSALLTLMALLTMPELSVPAAGATGASATGAVQTELARYPELLIRITETAIEVPVEVAAGRYHLIQENATDGGAQLLLGRLPDDVSDADAEAALAAEGQPAWFPRIRLAGNPDRAAAHGGRAEGIVDLPPGRYFAYHPGSMPRKVRRFNVVDGAAAPPATPAPTIVAELREMAFAMPDRVPAGKHLWEIRNAGGMAHDLAIVAVPAGATAEQVVTAFGARFAGDEPATTLGQGWTGWAGEPVAGFGPASPGVAGWAAIDLRPGTYAAVCFTPGPDGTPHLTEGMTDVFTVATLAADALDPRLAGHPEVTIRLTEERIEAPARVAAGRTLLIEENLEDVSGHAFVLRVPDDVAETEVAAALSAETPLAVAAPEWFWRGAFVGNPDRAEPDGGRAIALADLEPGRYVAGDPYRPPTEFARFEAVADPAIPTTGVMPTADLSAVMTEMAFAMPAEVPAGERIWQVENAGAMPHELAILPVPAGATVAHVQLALDAALRGEQAGEPFETQTAPAELGPAWGGWRPELVAGVGVLSPQRAVAAQIDLAPGTYAAVCFIPLPQTGERHLMMGMTKVFAVA